MENSGAELVELNLPENSGGKKRGGSIKK